MASTPVLAPLGEHLQRGWHRRTDEHRGKDGDRFWSRFGGEVHTNEQRRTGGTMTTDEERLPDPSALLGVYRFETRSPTTSLGRPSIEVIGRRRLGVFFQEVWPAQRRVEPPGWPGAWRSAAVGSHGRGRGDL